MAIGESPTSGLYRIRTSRGEIQLKCGPDILLNGIGQNLEAEANCPVCQRPIRFRIVDHRVEHLEPPQSILHAVEIVEGPGKLCVRCEASHIFDKDECLRGWLGQYQGISGSVYKLQEYMDHVMTLERPQRIN